MSDTPVADLIADLMSQGVPRDQAVTAGRKLEAALIAVATGGVTAKTKRERERLRKAAWRAANPKPSQGQKSLDISSSNSQQTQSIQKKENRRDSDVAVIDDWPSDFAERFWKAYIGPRKYDRPKVFAKLAKLRADKTVTWTALIAGLERYKATNPESKFIPAPMVWLNQHRWEADYGTRGPNGTDPTRPNNPSGPTDNYAAAAARRFGMASGNGPARGTAGPVQPAGRGGDDGQGSRGSDSSAGDFRPPYGR